MWIVRLELTSIRLGKRKAKEKQGTSQIWVYLRLASFFGLFFNEKRVMELERREVRQRSRFFAILTFFWFSYRRPR